MSLIFMTKLITEKSFKWSEQELMTIVDTVTPPGKKTSQVIQKYCRVTKTASGEKEYTSKTNSSSAA